MKNQLMIMANGQPPGVCGSKQLNRILQKQLSDQGLRIPQQSTNIITQLNKTNNTGSIIYDSDTQQFKGNVNGTFKVFQLD